MATKDSEAAAPVVGEPVDPPVAAVVPSVSEQNAAADRARGRTAVQVTTPTALVVLIDWACALQGWDLDPWSEGTGLPNSVSAAIVAVLTVVMAIRMNPKQST